MREVHILLHWHVAAHAGPSLALSLRLLISWAYLLAGIERGCSLSPLAIILRRALILCLPLLGTGLGKAVTH